MQDHASMRRDQRHHTFRREVIVIGDEMGSQPRSAGRISGRTFSHRGNDPRVVSSEVLTGGTMSNGTLNGRGRSLQMLGAMRSTAFPEEHGGGVIAAALGGDASSVRSRRSPFWRIASEPASIVFFGTATAPPECSGFCSFGCQAVVQLTTM